MPLVLDGTNGVSGVDGTASNPAIEGTDSNTGIFYPAADTVAIGTGGTEALRVNSSQSLLLNTTSAPAASAKMKIATSARTGAFFDLTATGGENWIIDSTNTVSSTDVLGIYANGATGLYIQDTGNVGIGTTSPADNLAVYDSGTDSRIYIQSSSTGTANTDGFMLGSLAGEGYVYNYENQPLVFGTNATARARIDANGNFLVGKTAANSAAGFKADVNNTYIAANSQPPLFVNRNTNDGVLVQFRQDDNDEGNISVSGTTVSYNGGHLSRYAQTQAAKDESILKGTVLSNLDEMNVYTDQEGNAVNNEQLNKVKVSDVDGDANVAGVFVNWSYDERHQVDEINMAMTGDMIIRIAQGITVQKGDLLMSAGDGTAKPQGDDIVRAKTIAKVTSNHVTCTYDDGSYCVPCVLMAC
jgi:hypothetical protein